MCCLLSNDKLLTSPQILTTAVDRKSREIIFLPKHSFQPILFYPKMDSNNSYTLTNTYITSNNSKTDSKTLNQTETKKLGHLLGSNISGDRRAKKLIDETSIIKQNSLTLKLIFFMAEINVKRYFIFLPQESSHFLSHFSNYKLKIYRK